MVRSEGREAHLVWSWGRGCGRCLLRRWRHCGHGGLLAAPAEGAWWSRPMSFDPALLDGALLVHQHPPVGTGLVPGVVFLVAVGALAGDVLAGLVLRQAPLRIVAGRAYATHWGASAPRTMVAELLAVVAAERFPVVWASVKNTPAPQVQCARERPRDGDEHLARRPVPSRASLRLQHAGMAQQGLQGHGHRVCQQHPLGVRTRSHTQ